MWYFRSPEIVFGRDALDHLTHLTGSRAFIVTDSVMLELGFVEQVQDRLRAARIECKIFSGVEHEPTLDIVRRGAAAMSAYQPDWVVGLGGGTPMDAAKAMWILYENPQVDLLAINPIEPLKLRQKAKMIAISATSGTGAEVSWGIVLTDPSVRQKLAVGSPENLPDIAIVDPSLATTMSPQLTADTGMDALTHAIEGYTSTWNNDFSDGLCLKAIQLIFRYLPRAVSTDPDWEAREKMHNAAAIAGLGFINSMCSLAHALGHSLGAQYQLPHGRAVGLFLPYTIQFNASDHDSRTRYGDIAIALGLPGANPQQGAESLVGGIHQLAETIGQPRSIEQALDVSLVRLEHDLEILTEHAASDTQIITAVRSPTTEDIEKLFRYAYDGRTIDW
ncbi:MAG: iron-containing alcohol dehydrogenase [Anaerolineae bacterium]|nr:iron-containing alcohol dehydrogenase [Anaerolineae bacterium]